MRQVVKCQCLYETYYATLMSKLNDKSILACLRRGEIPSAVFLDNRNEVTLENDHVQLDKDEKLENNQESDEDVQTESFVPELEDNDSGHTSRKRKLTSMNKGAVDEKRLKKTDTKRKPYKDDTKTDTNINDEACHTGGQEVKNTEENSEDITPDIKIGNDKNVDHELMNVRNDHACEANSHQVNVESENQDQGADCSPVDLLDVNESVDCFDSTETSVLTSLDHSYNDR